MFYGKKSVARIDEYYGINSDDTYKFEDCEKIQDSFGEHNILLTLAECRELYESWSDEHWCANWENGINESEKEYIFELLLPWLQDTLNDRIDRITIIANQLNKLKEKDVV